MGCVSHAQSSVTAQIQALERELGVRLFERLGKRVVLSESGRLLLGYAERILKPADEARAAIARRCSSPRGGAGTGRG
ncbi:LysR family transcriptional regulator, partial [Calditerricola satsumensis]|uniref:LysR family transcriptional regulator n=1 Tax=Calditerricola satsumensis TaxID=373054 RepID=UPI0012ED1154